MNHHPSRRIAHLLVAAVLGIGAFILVLTVTDPPGPGLDPDAMAYMGAAESVAAHAEYRVPASYWWRADSSSALTHFPPGYSTVLAIPVRLGMAPPQAARLVQATAAAVTVATLVLLVAATTTLGAGAVLGVALLAMPAMTLVHLSVLSEPLFLACTALTLAAMARRPTRPIVTGLAAAAGMLTRYAGAALVGAGVLWTLAEPGSVRERTRRGAVALLPAALLQGLWVIRTKLLREPAQIRHVGFYGNLGPTVLHAGATLRDWLVPDPNVWNDPLPHRELPAAGAVLLLVILLVLGTRHAIAQRRTSGAEQADGSPARLLAACGLLALCYMGILVVSRLFADAGIPFDERILAPFLLVVSVAVAVAVACWWRNDVSVMTRIPLVIAFICWITPSALTARSQARYALSWGSDFAGEQWRRSPLLEWARTEGSAHVLYTNWPAALYFHVHRHSHYLPTLAEQGRLAAFADTVRAHDGRVLVFNVGDAEYLTTAAVRHARGLRVVAEVADGVVLAAGPSGVRGR